MCDDTVRSRLSRAFTVCCLAALVGLLLIAPRPSMAAPPPETETDTETDPGTEAETETETGADLGSPLTPIEPFAEGPAPPPGSEESQDVQEPIVAEPIDPSVARLIPGLDCDVQNRGDPLFPILEALSTLRKGGMELEDCQQVESRLQGRRLELTVRGDAQDLLLYVFENLANDGFWIELSPTGKSELHVLARPSSIGGGVRFVRVSSVALRGTFLPRDNAQRLRRIAGLEDGNFFPALLAARLRELGYRADFFPVGERAVLLEVGPGRAIRRVRVHGYLPLSERDVLRQLSIEAQPGALARGQCVHPRILRGTVERPPMCGLKDVACKEWESREVERLEEFLFDSGYMLGTVSLGLGCGRDNDEADLHVFLEKRRPYKISRQHLDVKGVPNTRNRRWIRRQFQPHTLGIFRARITREFMEGAKKKVEEAFAEPRRRLGGFWRKDATSLPHPEIRVETSYDDLTREDVPLQTNLPLVIRVEEGKGVKPVFRAKNAKDGSRGLVFGEGQLAAQIQLFNRREPPTDAGADREAANLRAFYQSKGYLLAEVQAEVLEFGDRVELRFVIDEGPKVRIRNLDLAAPKGVPPRVRAKVARRWATERELRKNRFFSESSAVADIETVLSAYAKAGYLCATIGVDVAFFEEGFERPGEHAVFSLESLVGDTNRPFWANQFDASGLAGIKVQRAADLHVRLRVDPGPRVLTAATEEIHYLEEPIGPARRVVGVPTMATGAWGARRILADTPLRLRGDQPGGVPLDLSSGRDSAQAISKRYRDNGFPIADAEVTWKYKGLDGQTTEVVRTRDLTERRVGMCTEHATEPAVTIIPVVSVYEGRRGTFGDVLLRGNFKTQDGVIRRQLKFKQGTDYNQARVDRSVAQIEGLGIASRAQITPYPVGCEHGASGECRVHHVVTIEEAKDFFMTIDYGLGSATLNPFFVFARPGFPNVFGTAWDADFEGRWGFDLSQLLDETDLCAGEDCYERSALASFRRPQLFGSPVDIELSGRFQRRATPARGLVDTALGSLRFSSRIGDDWTVYVGYLFQFANISKDLVKPLGGDNLPWVNRSAAVVSDRTGVVDAGAVLTRVDNAFNPHDGFMATFDLKLASPWLGGQDWWTRVDLSWQHFIPIPRTRDRLSFRYMLRYGQLFPFKGPRADTQLVPEVWRYFGGGTADLGIRGILPETMLVDLQRVELPYGGTLLRPRAQGGHARAIGTIALQFVSVKRILGGQLAHSIFYDFGILTQFWDKVVLPRDYRHSIGANFIKWDINIVTLAVGYAILVPVGQNVRPTDDRNGRFTFNVGVTF